ncbi:acetyl-CoA hydrolase/transferase family protein [Thalassovita taeanensis]|uniref:Acetyl-CoA hydrolase n=1 Tax=Thalassovita taeanensis TaxID=657014 RepID=A0A1H9HAR0_9RHOB|nr:acetyl-CoA hydrolase/transferase C-terminal domain-containing protein [Thalassovita taeanensis]SEQ59410.1 acetyl-CoA hydrolase [Thalassovita taeanensis]
MCVELDLSALRLSDYIRPGDTLCWGQAAAEPLNLTKTLIDQRHSIGPIKAFIGIGFSETPDPALCDTIQFQSYCGTGTNRKLIAANCLDILPIPYSFFPKVLAQRVDVLLLQLAPTGTEGEFSFGMACEYLHALVGRARVVIAEVNDQVPATRSDWTISAADIDVLIRSSTPVSEATSPSAPTAVDLAIAEHVAALIDDGATLQVGLGTLPTAILNALSGHRDLGLHSGMINDSLSRLIESGVITNARKGRDEGISIGGMLTGDARTRAFCHNNPAIRLAPTEYTHAIRTLAQLNKFTAINSAIEVDLTGQANAEVAAGRYVGAVGGGTDFLRGAAASEGGLPILALPAALTTRSGKLISKIVTKLSGPTSVSRADAGIVVTEYGVADLRGLGLAARVEKMISIAHPDLREQLSRDAVPS